MAPATASTRSAICRDSKRRSSLTERPPGCSVFVEVPIGRIVHRPGRTRAGSRVDRAARSKRMRRPASKRKSPPAASRASSRSRSRPGHRRLARPREGRRQASEREALQLRGERRRATRRRWPRRPRRTCTAGRTSASYSDPRARGALAAQTRDLERRARAPRPRLPARSRSSARRPAHAVARQPQVAVGGVAAITRCRARRETAGSPPAKPRAAAARRRRRGSRAAPRAPRARPALARQHVRLDGVLVLVGRGDDRGAGLGGHLRERRVAHLPRARLRGEAELPCGPAGVGAPREEGQPEPLACSATKARSRSASFGRHPWWTCPTESRQPVSAAASAAP